jgi:hypothetical protein
MSEPNRAFNAASVQQIKYDCLAYLKEFGAAGWIINVASAPEEMVAKAGLDLDRDPWLWRAAMTERAARTVAEFLCGRFAGDVQLGDDSAPGPYIVLYRRQA